MSKNAICLYLMFSFATTHISTFATDAAIISPEVKPELQEIDTLKTKTESNKEITTRKKSKKTKMSPQKVATVAGVTALCITALAIGGTESFLPHTPQSNQKQIDAEFGSTQLYTSKHRFETFSIGAKTLFNSTPYFPEGDQEDTYVEHQLNLGQSSQDLKITWIGHSTFLIQINNVNILTDPIFFNLNPVAYRRKTRVLVNPDLSNLPPIHIILISHNHRDHMDEASLRLLSQKDAKTICHVPSGDRDTMMGFGFTNVEEFNWGHDITYSGVNFEFLPAIHWSSRGAFDLCKSLWGSWMISCERLNKTVYFCGDSAQGPHFAKIAKKYKNIDVALMPIGPTYPLECRNSHMDATEAQAAFVTLNAQLFVPMHWGTFRLGPDQFDTPIRKMLELKDDEHWMPGLQKYDKLYIPKVGQTLTINTAADGTITVN